MAKEAYSYIRVKRVKALHGVVKDTALKKGFSENDLVIIRSSNHHSLTDDDIKKVEGDPVEFIIELAKKDK